METLQNPQQQVGLSITLCKQEENKTADYNFKIIIIGDSGNTLSSCGKNKHYKEGHNRHI
jgi:hypothetical protein